MIKICQYCNRLIENEPRARKYHLMCAKKIKLEKIDEWRKRNREHVRKVASERFRRVYKPVAPHKLACIECGKEFMGRVDKKLCSKECKLKRQAKLSLMWQTENPEKYRDMHRKAAYKYYLKKRGQKEAVNE